MTHDGRTDEARRAVFIEAVFQFNQWSAWAHNAHRAATAIPLLPHPDAPEGRVEAIRLAAEISVFGTPALDAAIRRTLDAVEAFHKYERAYRAAAEQGDVPTMTELPRPAHRCAGRASIRPN